MEEVGEGTVGAAAAANGRVIAPAGAPTGLWAGVAVVAGLLLGSGGAAAGCAQLEGPALGELAPRLAGGPPAWDAATAPRVEALRPIYHRLARAARVQPALLVCDDRIFNAMAVGTRARGAVVFYLPLVQFLDGQPDAVAAVMAHEFAHLVLEHTLQKAAEVRDIGRWAERVANDHYRRTGNAAAAVAKAVELGRIEVAGYSRQHEREADEKGFSLAVTLAGFSGEGAKDLARRLSRLPVEQRPAYLETHPGWLERFDKADLLALNQSYLDQAAPLFEARRWDELSALVERWLAAVPASGAAWYYKGRLLARKPASQTAVTRTFEESLARYVDRGGLGAHAQEDQRELDDAWFSLCRALYDEGYVRESAVCARHIVSAERREAFAAGAFGGHLISAGAEPPAGRLLMAREVGGSKLITNDAQVAARRGAYVPTAPAWRAQRLP